MSKKDMVDCLRDMNRILVGRLKEKEEVKEFKRVYEEEREGEKARMLEVELGGLEEKKAWRKKELIWEASLEGERQRVDEPSKSVSQHREVYHEEVVKGRANEKRSLEDMVAQVVGGKKRRVEEEKKVRTALYPEEAQTFQVKVGVKVGGVLWEDGVDGVLVGLREIRLTIYEGSRWLVRETERAKRRESGKNSLTVLAMIGGGTRDANELSRSGVWVGARWCSVKRFVAIPPRKKECGWKLGLKKAVEEVRGELREVSETVESMLCNLLSIGDIMGRPRVEIEDSRCKDEVRRKTKTWEKEVEEEVDKKELLWEVLGKDWSGEVDSNQGEDDWVFDKCGKLIEEGGLTQQQFTARGWEKEIKKVWR